MTSADYSVSANSSFTSEEVQEWAQTGPSSMTDWVSWQPDWRLFDFDFLLEWGGRYGPALHQGQWWRWMTWGTHSTHLLCLHLDVVLWFAESEAEAEAEFKAGSECTPGWPLGSEAPINMPSGVNFFLSFLSGLGVNLCEE